MQILGKSHPVWPFLPRNSPAKLPGVLLPAPPLEPSLPALPAANGLHKGTTYHQASGQEIHLNIDVQTFMIFNCKWMDGWMDECSLRFMGYKPSQNANDYFKMKIHHLPLKGRCPDLWCIPRKHGSPQNTLCDSHGLCRPACSIRL